MGFGKSKSPAPQPTPQPVFTQQPVENKPIERRVNPDALERTPTNTASLLTPDEEERQRLMNGGYGMG